MMFFNYACIAAMALGSPTSAQSVGNWDINYLSLVTDFGVDSTDEVVVKYEIGKDRAFDVDLFDKGCINPITGITISKNPVRTPKDDIHDLLDIKLDIPKSSLSKSNIWTAFSSKVEFCARLQLKTEGGMVIKEDPRDIDIDFDFSVDFETALIALGAPSMTKGSGSTAVNSYVSACKCDNIQSFICNTDNLMANSELSICIKSLSPDIEIAYLDSFVLTQGATQLSLIEANSVQDDSFTLREYVPDKNGVGVVSIVPQMFWSYGKASTITVSGVIWLKLVGSRRLVAAPIQYDGRAVSIDASRLLRKDAFTATPALADDKQSSFELSVVLQRESIPEETVVASGAKPYATSKVINIFGAVVTSVFALL